ncbi:flagellin [Pradoshia eiseniae]|uniref:Flagellin n=1 Tax=Pradoshia eiseniae TaxID=2064768 RepID=A0A2S7N2K9_9BACI|nr:flagellin [Pradoshia eiseniae]PQD96235.1 flagellin [Pradoshia eiseniae]
MIINHNIASLNTNRHLSAANVAQGKSMEKLSSGLRINRAGDDAAGLAISEKMRGQIRGLNQASRNAQDGISLIQTAEGALNETHSILQRMRELAVQSSNDTNTDTDRAELQKEVDLLAQEITRISTDTEFNTIKLNDGTAKDVTFQIGANSSQNIKVSIDDMGSKALGVVGVTPGTTEVVDGLSLSNLTLDEYSISYAAASSAEITETTVAVDKDAKTITITLAQLANNDVTAKKEDVLKALNETGVVSATAAAGTDLTTLADRGTTGGTPLAAGTPDDTKGINITSQESADSAITTINAAIESVSAQRSNLGAIQNRLEYTINNLNTSSENLTAAESRIRDADMAKEISNQTKQSILAQASQAMLAQANQQPQNVLSLLR